ncbi:MAG: hypothetical protein Q9223_005984, partial [Gallowayella weberi]
MKALSLLTALVPVVAALTVRLSDGTDLTDPTGSSADAYSKRSSYQVGVHLYQAGDCSGAQAFPDRNHDEHSCNSATLKNGVANSARVKGDGTAHGSGCMTVFETSVCGGRSVTYTLTANACINFDSDANGFRAGCVVVGTNGGTCGTTKESCARGGLIAGTDKCDELFGEIPCPGQSCLLTPSYYLCCQGPTPITNPLACESLE